MKKEDEKIIMRYLNKYQDVYFVEVLQVNYNSKVKQLLTTCDFYEFDEEEDIIIYELHINDYDVVEFRDLKEVTNIFSQLVKLLKKRI